MGFFKKLKKAIKKSVKITPEYQVGKNSYDFTKKMYDKHTGKTAAEAQIAAAQEQARQQQLALERQMQQAQEDARKARVESVRASTFDQSQQNAGVGQVVLGTDNVEADLDEQLRKLRSA